MTSVFQMLNLPEGGTSMGLGPVVVSARWPAKTTAGGKRMRSVTVADPGPGGTSAPLKLWGAAADLPIQDGGTYTFSGKVSRKAYNGVPELSGESLQIAQGAAGEPAGQQQPAQAAQAAQGATSAPQTQAPVLTSKQLAEQMAQFVEDFGNALNQRGISIEMINQLLPHAPEFCALWWFGHKGVLQDADKPADEGEDPEIPY